MNGPLKSDYWYRVAKLRPFLRISIQVARHEYRGETWYMLRDPASGEYRRINQVAYDLVKHLDGERSLDEIYRMLLRDSGDLAPSQHEIINGISQLADASLLQTDRPADLRLLKDKALRQRKRWLRAKINPLSFQVAVMDPTQLLRALEKTNALLFSRWFAALWAALIVTAVATALSNLRELSGALQSLQGDSQFLLLLWLVYPALKLIHELAHGLTVRRFGGEVSEMGIRLLVLMPVPFVDASASTLFASKLQRAAVASAGIVAELGVAAIAMLLWVSIEAGIIRDCLLAIVLVGSISTLLFNGNPLMKFDGYYVASDLLELPNLAIRSKQIFAYFAKRVLLRLRNLPKPHTAIGETRWLLSYAILSWCYRLMIMLAIAMFVAVYSSIASIILLGVIGWIFLLRPAFNAADFLWTSPSLNGSRLPSAVVCTVLATVATLVMFVPAPSNTVTRGVVWLPDNAQIRAEVDGIVARILLKDGESVKQGQPVIKLRNSNLQLKAILLESELSALVTKQIGYLNTRSHKATILQDQIDQKSNELRDARKQVAALTLKAQATGRYILPGEEDLPGSWISAGDIAAYVIGAASTVIRVAVPNHAAAKIRHSAVNVSVRFSDSDGQEYRGEIVGGAPAGTYQLPNPALSVAYGGSIATEPNDPTQTIEPIFLVDVSVKDRNLDRAGSRALVRFDYQNEPLAVQLATTVRRLFLRRFSA